MTLLIKCREEIKLLKRYEKKTYKGKISKNKGYKNKVYIKDVT